MFVVFYSYYSSSSSFFPIDYSVMMWHVNWWCDMWHVAVLASFLLIIQWLIQIVFVTYIYTHMYTYIYIYIPMYIRIQKYIYRHTKTMCLYPWCDRSLSFLTRVQYMHMIRRVHPPTNNKNNKNKKNRANQGDQHGRHAAVRDRLNAIFARCHDVYSCTLVECVLT